MAYKYTKRKIKEKVKFAIEILLERDLFLLNNHAHERSVAHKLAEYLQVLFPYWNVDCEYNLKKLDTKSLKGIKECTKQKKTDRILPDIIIHNRNTDNNLVVIEIKTNNQEDICDIKKLKLFTSNEEDYRYFLGAFIKFNDAHYSIQWFEGGQEERLESY